MSNTILISICIPAYKHSEYLKRLLNSIAIQTFKDYEVVITDDSNDDSVELLVTSYSNSFPLTYEKNNPALGSPENWNAGIRKAKGKWIKMVHDDDWFADKNSLQEFAKAAIVHQKCAFIFSGFTQVDVSKNLKKVFVINDIQHRLLQSSPLSLFKENFIGHPSTTLITNNNDCFYDKNFKWVVDIEFYIRYLNKYEKFFAIRKPLINIGINEFQITKGAFRNPAIEIPEVLYFYYKLPMRSFKNIFVFDYYWRFIRNLSIRSIEDIRRYAPEIDIPPVIIKMIQFQVEWPVAALKNGFISKGLMFVSYLINYRTL